MRLFDILLALVALLFFAPLLLVIAAAVYVSDPGAILFAQRRIGYGGAYFRCFKFRSMAVNAEALLADLLASDPQARLEWELSHKLKEDRASLASAASCARAAWMNCPSCSTCCLER